MWQHRDFSNDHILKTHQVNVASPLIEISALNKNNEVISKEFTIYNTPLEKASVARYCVAEDTKMRLGTIGLSDLQAQSS